MRKLSSNIKYNNTIVKQEKEYVYLGIAIKPSGSFSYAITILNGKSLKALWKLKNLLHGHCLKPNVILKLYDALVKPIQMYNSEIWGSTIVNYANMFDICSNNNRTNMYDKMVIEKMHLKIMKYVLNVPYRTVNNAVRGELGRYPLVHDVFIRMYDYLDRMVKYSKNTLLYDAYLCNKSLMENGQNNWLNAVKNGLNSLGFNNMYFKNILENSSKSKLSKSTIRKKLRKIFERQWLQDISNDKKGNNQRNKLRTYRNFKNDFSYENYLNYISNTPYRITITKLRVSCHILNIEKGRHAKLNVEQRVCTKCNLNMIEDELHFIIMCPMYSILRRKYFTDISNIFPMFHNLTDPQKLNFIMIFCLNESDTANITAEFLHKIYEQRRE